MWDFHCFFPTSVATARCKASQTTWSNRLICDSRQQLVTWLNRYIKARLPSFYRKLNISNMFGEKHDLWNIKAYLV